MAPSVAQMLILWLQTLGIVYLLYGLARRLARAFWKRTGALREPEGGGV